MIILYTFLNIVIVIFYIYKYLIHWRYENISYKFHSFNNSYLQSTCTSYYLFHLTSVQLMIRLKAAQND